jgi:pantoate--beta-alanine ligase
MLVASTISTTRELIAALPRPIGFIPTMGALHAGHLHLIETARNECASVVVSVFVNPLQFAPNEDFSRYPRDFEADRAKLDAAGVDLLFAPEPDEMYPPGFSTYVDAGPIGSTHEGAIRPTHFRGVATVVAKLLNIVTPDVMFLGQKDAQQTAVLRRMVRDLAFATRVAIVPTQRENDGLALSSRNVYLNAEERAAAPSLHASLEAVERELRGGTTVIDALERARENLAPPAQLEYIDVVDAETFEPLDRLRTPAFIVGAARFGNTRLIDNVLVE